MPKHSSVVEKKLSRIFTEQMHALSNTTLQKYKLSLIQEAVCSLEGFEFLRFNCVSVQHQASTLEPVFIVETVVRSINKSSRHRNTFKALHLPVNGRLAKILTILKHISALLYYSTSPVRPNWQCKCCCQLSHMH